MKQIVFVAAIALVVSWAGQASAAGFRNRSAAPWNGPYYSAAWGMPVAVVVPPTARTTTNLGSTVNGSYREVIRAKFRSDYPAGSTNPATFVPAPIWPDNTDQMGYYYVRGPRK